MQRILTHFVLCLTLAFSAGCLARGDDGAGDLWAFEWARIPQCTETDIDQLAIELNREDEFGFLESIAYASPIDCRYYRDFVFEMIPYGEYDLEIRGYSDWGSQVFWTTVPVDHECSRE